MFPNSIELHQLKDIPLMKKVIAYLAQINRLKLILTFWAVILITDLITLELLYLIEPEFLIAVDSADAEIFSSLPLIWVITIAAIVAPFLETLIFQFIILLTVKKITDWITKSNSWIYSFLITSLLFSSSHAVNFGLNYFGLLYALAVILSAFLFTILSITEIERKNGHPILSVSILHGLCNLIAILLPAIP